MLGSSRCCHFHTFKRLICASPDEGTQSCKADRNAFTNADMVSGAKQVRAALPKTQSDSLGLHWLQVDQASKQLKLLNLRFMTGGDTNLI